MTLHVERFEAGLFSIRIPTSSPWPARARVAKLAGRVFSRARVRLVRDLPPQTFADEKCRLYEVF